MSDEWKVLELLDRPVSVLQLSADAYEVLSEVGVETVGELLDQEWALYPTAVFDEIREAVASHGLLAAEDDAGRSRVSPLPREELERREWERILWSKHESAEVHVAGRGTDGQVDWDLLTASTLWRRMTRLWVEGWSTDPGTYRDDFRPWLEALAAHPPPHLRSLEMGGYSDRSIDARLGAVSETARALPRLESLSLTGRFDQVAPLDAPSLTYLSLESTDLGSDRVKRLLGESRWPSLRSVSLRSADFTADAEACLPLFRQPSAANLRQIELAGYRLSGQLFDAIGERLPAGQLEEEVSLENCLLPEDIEEERTVIDAVIRTRSTWSSALLVLPTDAQDYAEELRQAGLRCAFGD